MAEDELAAEDAASVYFFARLRKTEADTVSFMIGIKDDKDTEEKIRRVCRLFFANPQYHTARALEYEKNKVEVKQAKEAAEAERKKIETERKRAAGDFAWTWPESKTPITAEDVKNDLGKLEDRLKIFFPEDYKQFVCKHGGRIPQMHNYPNVKLCYSAGPQAKEFHLGNFWTPSDVRLRYGSFDGIPEKAVTFADDSYGSLILFDFRLDPKNPLITFQDHDGDGELELISKTFTEFVNGIQVSLNFQPDY